MSDRATKGIRYGIAATFLVVLFVVLVFYIQLNPSQQALDSNKEYREQEPQDRPLADQIEKEREINRKLPLTSPFVQVAKSIKPSVVNIAIKQKLNDPHQFYRDSSPLRDFFKDLLPEVPRESRQFQASGTGLIIDSKGWIVTNNHVIENATQILVKMADGNQQIAKVVGTDPETDLALLKINRVPEEKVAKLGDSDRIKIGDWAIAMGNALGLDWTLTVGVISAKGRNGLSIAGGGPIYQDFIQTDASINFGNSGGPLANIHGEVIGINTAINTGGQNLGFAIPINLVQEIVQQLEDHGTVIRGYLGVVPGELTPVEREALSAPAEIDGVVVLSVQPGTPAEDGGLQPADIIVELDGTQIKDVESFRMFIARHRPGDTLKTVVFRDNSLVELSFTLGDRAEFLAAIVEEQPPEQLEWKGITVVSLDDPRVSDFPIEVNEGVVVINLQPGSEAAQLFSAGDVLIQIDDHPIHDLEDWKSVTAKRSYRGKAVLIKYYPGGSGNPAYVAIKE